jgi:hypothetical protein
MIMNTMEPENIIDLLEQNQYTFKALLKDISHELIYWKPAPDKWCLLEILCHLYDEEREDFRTRVKSVLEDPRKPLPKIDPLRWVTDHEYMKQEYLHKLLSFLTERQKSVEWLRSLKIPDWENTYQHPQLGPMSAFLFLNNWLAHDFLHIRQINKNKYLFLKAHVSTSLDYAGNW